jgi:hypothetical protein
VKDVARELLRVARDLVAARVEDFATLNREYDIVEIDEDDLERFFKAFGFKVENLTLTPRSAVMWLQGPRGDLLKAELQLKRSRLLRRVDVRADGYVKIDFKNNIEFV